MLAFECYRIISTFRDPGFGTVLSYLTVSLLILIAALVLIGILAVIFRKGKGVGFLAFGRTEI